jgi:hypothetical protein
MTRAVLWRCPCDGRLHLAALTGCPTSGYRVRAVCGRATDAVRLPDLQAHGEVTCPACRTEGIPAALAKLTAA